MIITRLTGGLGNQLFQYALGRSLAEVHHSECVLDLSHFSSNSRRIYCLDNFRIHARVATDAEVVHVLSQRSQWERWGGVAYHKRMVVRERSRRFDPIVLRLDGPRYFQGYWQSELYFKHIRERLLEETALREPLRGHDRELAEQIVDTNSVALHVRRGDYIELPSARRKFGTCPLSYYDTAIAQIRNSVHDPHLFIFSDDIPWCRANLSLSSEHTFVESSNPSSGCIDLDLMRLCKHFIIANSSFSWWGAWLSEHSHKQVFAPARWFRASLWFNARETRDRIPPEWVRV